jgi:ABC-type multidrug transport system fused ATPase/permease subunit
LGRALVKDSRIIILDEATSSVDVETDAKVQHTIRTEFKFSTLLCIAHRLNTVGKELRFVSFMSRSHGRYIAHYDRILVMDDGQVAEFDTVLNLYDNPQSIFRSLCEEASLTRAEILRLRADQR